jgi:hypothetical protein
VLGSQSPSLLQRGGICVNVAGRLTPAASRQEGPISEMSYKGPGARCHRNTRAVTCAAVLEQVRVTSESIEAGRVKDAALLSWEGRSARGHR